MYEVIVEGLELYGYHGVFDAERAVGHRINATIRATVEGKATETDSVEDTIDYTRLASLMKEVSAESKVQTLERLAQRFSDAAFAEFPMLESLDVYLKKPSPPMELVSASTGVRLVTRR